MAKKIMMMKNEGWWLEVAPSPFMFPQRSSSHYPKLETIKEDRAEGIESPIPSSSSEKPLPLLQA